VIKLRYLALVAAGLAVTSCRGDYLTGGDLSNDPNRPQVATANQLFAGAEAATWIYRALVLLVIACPCALVISTPVSIVAALSAAARHGVLIKGGASLERLASIRIVAFDKTGTLTKGELTVTDVAVVGRASALDVIRLAAAVEARSAHPVAAAISRHAQALLPD